MTLRDFAGPTLVLSVVPSLDTPMCETQTKRFNDEAAWLPAGVAVLTLSMDLPSPRRASAASIASTGCRRPRTTGTGASARTSRRLRLEARALFVIGPDGRLRHVQDVPEVTDHPDYDAALAAAR